MNYEKNDDNFIMKAVASQNRGDHYGAYRMFQRAGNQCRNPSEKEQLWIAAERAKRIHDSD